MTYCIMLLTDIYIIPRILYFFVILIQCLGECDSGVIPAADATHGSHASAAHHSFKGEGDLQGEVCQLIYHLTSWGCRRCNVTSTRFDSSPS